MSNPSEHSQGAVIGSPLKIVAHLERLGNLYESLGFDRAVVQSPLGEQIEGAALEALDDLMNAQGATAADALGFAMVARLQLSEAVRSLAFIPLPSGGEVVTFQLEMGTRLLGCVIETLAKLSPNTSPALKSFATSRMH